jgi:pantetheine-phosphate adenylyltransferase
MRVALAGTFGPIHDGHRNLFEHALQFGDEGVLVGVTSDDLAQETRHEPRPVPPFEERKANVEGEFEKLDEWGRDVTVVEITGEYGTATEREDLDALIVSPETAPELAGLNDERRANGLEPLVGITVPYVYAADGERISSTRIVKGEIDEHGNLLD